MNYIWKSSFITNIGIFILGMFIAFLVFSQIGSPITASIQDAFSPTADVDYNADVLRSHDNNVTNLVATKQFDNLSGAVLHISFLYNNAVSNDIAEKITSSYWFSSINTNNTLTVSLVLPQNIEKDTSLLSFSRGKYIDIKDIPVIESISLFYDNQQEELMSYFVNNNQSH